MKRYVALEEISDGKLYTTKDLVKADCLGCRGCSKCCHGMGDTIQLDPYDIRRLQNGAGKSFQMLLEEGKIELGVVDGVILPHLAMQGPEEACGFLSPEGRCSIHAFRPGICRLFPLGRYYEDTGFRYFLQTGECDGVKAKIKVSKWMDTPGLEQYEAYIRTWHELLKKMENLFCEASDLEKQKQWNMAFLNLFFMKPYSDDDFYTEFEQRRSEFLRFFVDFIS